MHELVRTTDPTVVSAATAYLKGEGIEAFVFDVHMSVLEGSIGVFPRRIVVREEDARRAREILDLVGIDTVAQR